MLACALLAALLALAPEVAAPRTAEAQTGQAETVSVSNISQARDHHTITISGNKVIANAFTTGGTASDRYRLDSVVLNYRQIGNPAGQMDVSIHALSGSDPGAQIGASLTGTISPPSGAPNFDTTYTASGVTLAGGTTYVLRVAAQPGASRALTRTGSDTEIAIGDWSDGTGASISDTSRHYSGSQWSGHDSALRLTVNATVASHVGNLGETAGSDGGVGNDTLYNSFTTGGTTADRFTLDSVTLGVTAQAANVRVGIYQSSGTSPGTQLGANLNRVGTAATGDIAFTASGITLNGATTYWIGLSRSEGQPRVGRTSTNGQTGTGGWSIGDNVVRYDTGSSAFVPAWLEEARFEVTAVQAAAAPVEPPQPPVQRAQATSSVSNITQTNTAVFTITAGERGANAFTTGGTTADRFRVDSVVLDIVNSGTGSLDVSIHNASGANPGTKIGANLTGTIGGSAGNTTYTAGNVILSGGTTYFVQWARASGSTRTANLTNSDTESGTGAWTGATIANTFRYYNGSAWSNVSSSLKFTVNATEAPPVSNLGETATATAGNVQTANDPLWQAFTTGGASHDRFALNGVVINVDANAANLAVSIYDSSGANPGSKIGSNLTQVGSAASGEITYTASGITLDAKTTYWLTLERISGTDPTVERTASNAQAAAPGWSIGDTVKWKSGNTYPDVWSESVMFSVDATKIAPVGSVSNILKTNSTDVDYLASNFAMANAFTIPGTTTNRYTLSNVVLDWKNSGSGNAVVQIRNPGTGLNSDNPGTQIGSNLTGSIDSDAGNTTYTASGITLTGGKTYFVVVAGATALNRELYMTTDNAEDGTSTTGWTIANAARIASSGFPDTPTWGAVAGGHSLKFTVNARTGSYVTPTVGNLAEADTEADSVTASPIATSFTTGGTASDAYTLDDVAVHFASGASAAGAKVEVYTDSSGSPGFAAGLLLARVGSPAGGEVVFNPPTGGVTLYGATTYWLVVTTPSGTAVRLTSSNGQAGDAGWSVGDNTVGRSGGSWSQGSANSVRFALNATKAGDSDAVQLVSNTSQGSTRSSAYLAQSFTTGAGAGGYTLASVQVQFNRDATVNPDTRTTAVTVRSNSTSCGASGPANCPAAGSAGRVATLTLSGTGGLRGVRTFTAPSSTTLDPSTVYWISVNEGVSANRAAVDAGTTGSHGAAGWSVGTGYLHRTAESAVWSSNTTASLKAAVVGYSNPLPATVTNLGEADTAASGATETKVATSFTVAGTASDAHTLDDVTVHFASGAAASGAGVSIYADSSGSPDFAVGAALARQGSAASGQITFNKPGTGVTLYGGSTYWLVVDKPSGTDVRLTNSNDQASATGWAIGDNTVSLSGTTWSTESANSIRFALNATAAGETTPVVLETNAYTAATGSDSGYLAQSFTTGSEAGGYTLTAVQVRYRDRAFNNGKNTAATLRSDSTSCGSGGPTNCPAAGASGLVASLTLSGSGAPRGVRTFTAPAGTVLDPSKTYWVSVNEGVSTNRAAPSYTTDDDSHGAPGWSIGDGRLRRGSETEVWATDTRPLQVGPVGYSNPTTAVTLGVSPQSVAEGSSVTVTATLAKAQAGDVVIPLTLTAGSAEPGDFGALASITITAGQTSNTATITTVDDADRSDETFTVALGTLPIPLVAGAPSSQVVTITDPDTATVSNLGEADTAASGATESDIATSFRTAGTVSDAHTLTDVTVHFHSGATASGAAVGIYTDSSGSPDLAIGPNLVRQGSAASGEVTFNAPTGGITLYGNTTYWLRVTKPSGTDVRLTSSDVQASASGWTIGDNTVSLSGTTWSQESASSIRFDVFAAAAGATTPVHLESNTGAARSGNSTDAEQAQSFTTGSKGTLGGGWTLTEVQIDFVDASSNDGTSTAVAVRRDSANCGSGGPSSCPDVTADGLVATLTRSGSGSLRGLITFTAPSGTALDPSTTYWVSVNRGVAANRAYFNRTADNDSHGAPGWSIGDTRLRRNTESWATETDALKLAVVGYAAAQTVTLSVSPDPVAEGSPVTVTATLSTRLTSPVVIPITLTRGTAEVGDYGTLPSITIPVGSISNTDTITTTDDGDPYDETFTVAFGTLPSGLSAGAKTSEEVTISDPDTVGLVFSPGSVSVKEGETERYTVRLAAQPSAAVTVTISGHSGTDATPSPTTLNFTTANWNTAQTVTVATVEDADEADDSVTLAHTASGGDYASVAKNLSVTIKESSLEVTAGNRGAVFRWEYDEDAKWWFYRYWPTDRTLGYVSAWRTVPGYADRWTVTGLSPGIEYTFEFVRQGFDNVNSTPDRVRVTPTGSPTGRPAAPGGASGFAGDGQIVARWDRVAGADYYEYKISTSGCSSGFGAWAANTGAWTDSDGLSGYNVGDWAIANLTGLTNGTAHYVRIRAVDDIIVGHESACVTVQPTPLAATGLSAVAGVGKATLTWAPPASVPAGYVWQYYWEDSERYQEHDVQPWTTASASDAGGGRLRLEVTGLQARVEHTLKVRLARRVPVPGSAVYAFSPVGQAVSVTATPTRPAAPDPVTDINVTHNGTSLSVTWTAPERATHYDVTYYNTANSRNARGAWNRAGTQLTIACDARNDSQDCVNTSGTYIVGIRARNAGGTSSWANSAPTPYTGAPNPQPPPPQLGCGSGHTQVPDAVTGISVTHNGTSLSVTWTAPARAACYDVTYTGNNATARAAWDRAGTSLTITCDSRNSQDCVVATGVYSVGIRAKNNAGPGPWTNSAAATYTDPNAPPPQGDGCNTTISSNGTTTGTWNSNCRSQGRRGHNAKFHTFTLSAQSEVTITLESSTDPYMYLRSGNNTRSGHIITENDDIGGGNYNSRIVRTLSAGTYTIEATTFGSNRTGNYTLTISGLN